MPQLRCFEHSPFIPSFTNMVNIQKDEPYYKDATIIGCGPNFSQHRGIKLSKHPKIISK